MRLFGIIGTDFCGSTFLSRLFWCVDGTAGAGELHWLVDGRERERQCYVCGPGCRVLPRAFCMAKFDALSLYSVVAEKLRVESLVVSDKHTRNYRRLCGPNRMEAGIVLYKKPQAQCISDLRHRQVSVKESLQNWMWTYSSMLGPRPPWVRRLVFVSYEDLANHPKNTMQRLCGALDLPVPETVRLRDVPYHHIGGNRGAIKSRAIECDERWRRELSEEQLEEVLGHGAAWGLYDRLQELAVNPL